MDDTNPCTLMPSPEGEDYLRPAEPQSTASHPEAETQSDELRHARQLLIRTFAVPISGIGLAALAHELRADLDALDRGIVSTELPDALRKLLDTLCQDRADAVRDLAYLRSLPACPLRDLLTQPSLTLPPPERRCLRSVRALLALHLLSESNGLGRTLAAELSRWMRGKGLRFAQPLELSADELRLRRDSLPPGTPQAALMAVLVEALSRKFSNPFVTRRAVQVISHSSGEERREAHEAASEVGSDQQARSVADPLRGRKATIGKAGCRVLSGTPALYEYAQPFELEAIVPKILDRWRTGQEDEALGALLTLHLGVMPSSFCQVPLTSESGAGIRINLAAGCLEWNLDEVIGRHTPDNSFTRSSSDRYVQVPLPSETVAELRRRQQSTGGKTLADLFDSEKGHLGKKTKLMLRELSLTSHRPALKRLSFSWGRYVLSRTGDETYAAAMGVDFTLGTTANLNYCLLRAARIRSIASECYRRVGLSGNCGGQPLPDVGSLRLIPDATARAFIRDSLSIVRTAMTGVPRRCAIEVVHEAHNLVATHFYAALKFILAGRSLQEETLTRRCIDVETGLFVVTDKRTARYHEHRLGCLPPTLREWLRAYLAWLSSVAYRMASIDPHLARAIRSVAEGDTKVEAHPLFFCFSANGTTAPLGAHDISPILGRHQMASNAGRHFLDVLFRDAGLDSAAVMGWMGRAMPGQEIIGAASSVAPLEFLLRCATVIEDWLSELALPPAPAMSSRKLHDARHHTHPEYRPVLLDDCPASLKDAKGAEPCPIGRDTIHLAAQFPDLLRFWRTDSPPGGWAGIALSLIFEDAIVLDEEVIAVLQELRQGILYRHREIHFVDARPAPLGIRRVWLSPITVRLIYQTPALGGSLVTLDTISEAFRLFLTMSGADSAGGSPVSYVTACARAYFALRTPGILRAWMDGSKFSRTVRPHCVARQYLGLCEPPAPRVSRNSRTVRRPDAFRKHVRDICDDVPASKSHRRAIDELREWLDETGSADDPSSEHELSVGYCRSLLDRHDNVHTILRYLTAAAPFLHALSRVIASDGLEGVDWLELINEAPEDKDAHDGHDSAPTRAAINQALDWLGIDYRLGRRVGPPPAALRYTDLLTDRETRLAISMLAARRRTPGDEWHRAEAALRLMSDVALRWDEIINLRLTDVWIGSSPAPHIVVTNESRAALKTRNARRVLPLNGMETIREVRALYDLRSSRFGGDKMIPLLGADLEDRATDSGDRIHDLVTEALRRASGAWGIHPHCTRGTVITSEIDAVLSPSRHERRPIDLRQALYSISARAGHGHPDVTVGEYFAGMDHQRRDWATEILRAADCPPRPAFLEALTGIAAATYRKRLSRGLNDDWFDVLEGLQSDAIPTVGAKVCELGSLVQAGLEEIPWTDADLQEERLTATAIYLGLRMLKEEIHSARLTARLTRQETESAEQMLSELQRARLTRLAGRRDLSRQRFITEMAKARLPAAIAACNLDADLLREVVLAAHTAGDPLTFARPEHALRMSPLLGPIRSADIQTVCLVRSSGQSAVDTCWLDRFRNAGFGSVQCRPPRDFPRGSQCKVLFCPKSSDSAGHRRASPRHAFLVTISILAVHFRKELKQ
ncbi:MAG TPA: hypothetical protein PLQ71_19680 [Nitrospira sp.]|nr:hypothetical protein [Nitrospira sp.]